MKLSLVVLLGGAIIRYFLYRRLQEELVCMEGGSVQMRLIEGDTSITPGCIEGDTQ